MNCCVNAFRQKHWIGTFHSNTGDALAPETLQAVVLAPNIKAAAGRLADRVMGVQLRERPGGANRATLVWVDIGIHDFGQWQCAVRKLGLRCSRREKPATTKRRRVCACHLNRAMELAQSGSHARDRTSVEGPFSGRSGP